MYHAVDSKKNVRYVYYLVFGDIYKIVLVNSLFRGIRGTNQIARKSKESSADFASNIKQI